MTDDTGKYVPRDIFGDCLFPRQFKPLVTIAIFQILAFVQMLNSAADVVKRAHKIVMATLDEQLRPALELLLGFSGIRQDHALDAAAILVDPIDERSIGARFHINFKSAKQTPVAAPNPSGG